MANPKTYRMDAGEWLSADKVSGEGRGSVTFAAPSWTGREDRLTVRVVRSGKNMQAVSIRQLGVVINEVPTEVLEFPIKGGSKQILVTTNAAALTALITSDMVIKGSISSFTTASGLNITVNDIRLNYGFPGDPGLESEFQVSLIVTLPDNSDGDEVNEYITVNGTMIKIYQPGRVVPYIELDKEFEQLDGNETSTKLEISSNIEGYTIEIVECSEEQKPELNVIPEEITLDADGSAEKINIQTKPSDLGWRFLRNG